MGCVDHDYEEAMRIKKDHWLHDFIYRNSKKCIGIDIEKEGVEKLNKMGYKCMYGNVENFNFKEKFDVIVAGEIIEHLFNPGNFLECVKKHLKKNGKFIITTPNPYFFRYLLQIILRGKPNIRYDHTSMYNIQTLSYLLEQKGFKVEYIYWINFSPKKYKLGYWISYFGYFNANFLIISSLFGKNERY
jgi:2-polyprenyl-3-methyl-5-hydroxy-6-metoxy-1,4-benzoquinol methylase